jgi:hypothetical protein
MLAPLVLGSLVALTSTSPVRIAGCRVMAPVSQVDNDSTIVTSGFSVLHVRFANASQRPISRVTFALDDGTTVTDAGTFTPGATIDHAMALTTSTASSCSVKDVRFADGSTWAG